VNKRIQIRDSRGNLREFHESVRLYEPEELKTLLAGHHLETEKCFGTYDGQPWSPPADRLILVARRKSV
jgi:hypothetical protein